MSWLQSSTRTLTGIWCCSLVDTAVVGMQSATDLAALGPGTLLIDYSCYVFTFLAVAGSPSCNTMCWL